MKLDVGMTPCQKLLVQEGSACNILLQPPPYTSVIGGSGRLLHALNSTFLYQQFLSSLHFYTCFAHFSIPKLWPRHGRLAIEPHNAILSLSLALEDLIQDAHAHALAGLGACNGSCDIMTSH